MCEVRLVNGFLRIQDAMSPAARPGLHGPHGRMRYRSLGGGADWPHCTSRGVGRRPNRSTRGSEPRHLRSLAQGARGRLWSRDRRSPQCTWNGDAARRKPRRLDPEQASSVPAAQGRYRRPRSLAQSARGHGWSRDRRSPERTSNGDAARRQPRCLDPEHASSVPAPLGR